MSSNLAHSQPFRSSLLWVHAGPLNRPNNLYNQRSNNLYGDSCAGETVSADNLKRIFTVDHRVCGGNAIGVARGAG